MGPYSTGRSNNALAADSGNARRPEMSIPALADPLWRNRPAQMYTMMMVFSAFALTLIVWVLWALRM